MQEYTVTTTAEQQDKTAEKKVVSEKYQKLADLAEQLGSMLDVPPLVVTYPVFTQPVKTPAVA